MATSSIKLRGDDKSLAGYLKSLPKKQRDIAEALDALIVKTQIGRASCRERV